MLTEFVRDHAFAIAWFGLMTLVWCGWGQEAPTKQWSIRLGIASGLGLVLTGLFGYGVFRRWRTASALEGQYHWFGVLVAAEVILAGVGCVYLWRNGRTRWMAWWVAIVVAAHFIPLALLLRDWSMAVLGLVQLAALIVLLPRFRADDGPTSRLAGPVTGLSLLAFSVISAVVFVIRWGAPW